MPTHCRHCSPPLPMPMTRPDKAIATVYRHDGRTPRVSKYFNRQEGIAQVG